MRGFASCKPALFDTPNKKIAATPSGGSDQVHHAGMVTGAFPPGN
jgi:hypothetical protein